MPKFTVDQRVWVRTSETGDHEETAKVLDPQYDDEDLGVLVQLDISGYKLSFPVAQVRALEEEEEDEDSSTRRSSRRSRRAVITPSPKTISTASSLKRASSLGSSITNNTTAPSLLESVTAGASSEEENEDESLPAKKSQDDPDHEKEEKKPSAKRKKKEVEISETETNKPAAKKKPTRAAVIALQNDSSEEDEATDDGEEEEDEEDEDHKTFQVDYAPTGRATCRRCDAAIVKGSVRISHVPLFRGKPGFRVYRHVQCALFDETVHALQDVGGWKKLQADDQQVLTSRIQEAKLEMEKENEELEPDELVQQKFEGEIRGPPPGLEASLLPFQVEGVSWMHHQEVHKPEIRGGILADEMGMGKTLQTITTILDNRPLLQHSKPGAKHPPSSPDIELRTREEALWADAKKDWAHDMAMNNVPKKILTKKNNAARAGTLVVCPLIALSQWKTEIEKFTLPNTLSVGTYHGPNRTSETPAAMIQKYDIILTTYQVLEQDFRKMVSPNKVTCPNCNGKFKIDKLRVHLKYFCGESAKRTEAQSRQRRSSENNNNRRGRGGGNKKSNTKDSKKKPPMSETKGTKTTKSIVRVKRTADYDSDSDLSIDVDVAEQMAKTPAGRRPCRGAARSAVERMSSSVKEWGTIAPGAKRKKTDSDDESSVASWMDSASSEGEDGDDSSSEDEPIKSLKKRKAVAPASKRKSNKQVSAVERARQKQAEALEKVQAKGKKGRKASKSKKPPAKKKKMTKGKKKKFDDEDDSSSSSDESVGGAADDPMEGIDLDALMAEAMDGSKASPLHSFCWWRIVLDEAHFIKSRSSQTAAAAFALTSIHRWCLSGTPLQNRVGELYSLIRFLRIDPMAHYFCRQKDCSCKSIHYRMQHGKCLDCGHRSFSHFAHFNRHVLGPIQRDGYTGDGRRAMFKLKNEVLDKSLLRRTKETRAEDMNLPPRVVTIRTVRLHPIEEDFYEALYTQTKSSFDDYVAEGTLLNNYAHIFDLLTKMRQAVDHPYLIVHSKRSAVRMQGQQAAAVANGTVDCEMCHETPTDRVISSCCGSGFCRSCVIEYLSVGGGENTPCPSCRNPFTIDLNQASEDTVDDGTLALPDSQSQSKSSSSVGVPSLKEMSHVATGSILRRINLAEFATSTKIEVLVQELIEMRKKRPGSKALVFSQFTSMLDLVRWRLHSDPYLADLGLGVKILHGGMDVKSRDAALEDFREDNDCRVLLMSLKAAGVALNLTVASECFLLDLWWNPAAEMQAIDRLHRLGQYRPIRAVRFVAEGTVEERVLQLQEKKRLVFDGTVGRDAGSLKMLTAEDMKALFA